MVVLPAHTNGAAGAEADTARAGPALPSDALERLIVDALDDDKAQNVVVIPLTDKSSVTDAMIIASGRSQRHVGAVADHLLRRLKDAGAGNVRVEGLPACDWVLIDAGDVVVHVFRPEVRAFYNLEKLWSADGPIHSESA